MTDRMTTATTPSATRMRPVPGAYRPVGVSPINGLGQGCSGSPSTATPTTVPTVAAGPVAFRTNGSRRLEEFPP